MKRDLYFKELAVVLGRAGFTPLPQEDDSMPVEYITTASLWGRMNRAFHATRTNAVPTVSESHSGRMWRAAIPDIVFTTLALTENFLCSRHQSICSHSSPCILKIGNRITMYPAVERLRSL